MMIQKHYRGLKQREAHKELMAAIYVQKMYRAWVERDNFQRQKAAFLLTRVIRFRPVNFAGQRSAMSSSCL